MKEIQVPNPKLPTGNAGTAPGGSEGFTLLEVLVALLILSVSLAVLLAAFSQGLAYARENTTEAAARTLAQSLLAQAQAAPNPAFGDSVGQSAALHWRVHIAPYGNGSDQTAWQQRAQQIDATVSWNYDGRARTVSLSTLRLAPGAVQQ
jgi:general secretion pathway protein I